YSMSSFLLLLFFFMMLPRPPTSTLFPYTTLFRSCFRWIEQLTLSNKSKQRNNCKCMIKCSFAPEQTHPFALKRTTRLQGRNPVRSEEHTSELQSRENLVCRLLLEKKKKKKKKIS